MANLPAIAQSFLAILAGFVAIAALVVIVTVVLKAVAPGFAGEEEHLRTPYMIFNLAFSAISAPVGGWITARLTPAARNPLTHALMLAIVMLVLGALSAVQLRGKQPMLYQMALTAMTPVAVLLGGLVRMHQLGYVW